MNAYQKGYEDGLADNRNDRIRKYESDKAENNYWDGYTAGIIARNPTKRIVQCEREGKIFTTKNVNDCTCPVCGRRYINGESDRKLKIIL